MMLGQLLMLYLRTTRKQKGQAGKTNYDQCQRKRTGKMPHAQYAWNVLMMLSCSFVLIITRVVDHTCVVPIINIPIVLSCLKMLIRGRNQHAKSQLQWNQVTRSQRQCCLRALSAVGKLKGGQWSNLRGNF